MRGFGQRRGFGCEGRFGRGAEDRCGNGRGRFARQNGRGMGRGFGAGMKEDRERLEYEHLKNGERAVQPGQSFGPGRRVGGRGTGRGYGNGRRRILPS
jgi:hypothetical protein